MEEQTKNSTMRVIRRFSSIKLDFEKEKRRTLCKYQQQGLRVSFTTPNVYQSLDKAEIRKKLRISVERYSLPELYVKMICALFPNIKSRESPDSNALVQHLKRIFRLNDLEHNQLVEIAKMTKLPQRIVNLEIVEARNIPAKDANGLSDPFCVVFVNSRDVAQRTKVIHNTLNPVWKQYFTFKVNDPNRDVLILEVMDYNEDDESFRDRFRKLKEIKSASTFGVLLKEIANARSIQELIGSVRIPVVEISSETIEKWFKLKNHEDRGEIYLRMALGYNKSKETATEEFLQIIHFVIAHELDKDTALGAPFHWDEHYEMWSKYILRQFKWQGGLKPKDIVLAKWRAYTIVNAIFPLNANMMCLLLDAVLERVIGCEYDSREIFRFWESTELLVNTIMAFLTDVHDLLPSPVTVLHTYHLLKILELLNQFLAETHLPAHGNIPFKKSDITDRVVKAIRDGANKFYIKVFSDSTHDSIQPGQDPLYFALERLLKMGQILHEDIRLGVSTINADFNGLLNVDYLRITFQVYDEQWGKMVKHIVEDYNTDILDKNNTEMDDAMDENSFAVKSGLAVLKLYLASKNLTELAPVDYLDDQISEYSLTKGIYDWFYHSVATWIDILRNRIIKWMKNSITVCEGNRNLSRELSSDSMLTTTDKQDRKDIPISSSAVDTAQMFLEIHKFWMSLGWQNPQQSYIIVRKIVEELCGYFIYYASELLEATNLWEQAVTQTDDIDSLLLKACIATNNINYVKEQVNILIEQLNISDIIEKNKKLKTASEIEDDEAKVESIRSETNEQVGNIVEKILKNNVKLIVPKFQQLLHDVTAEYFSKTSIQNKRLSLNRVNQLISFLDSCIMVYGNNLESYDFHQARVGLWSKIVDGMEQKISLAIDTGKSSECFLRLKELLQCLKKLFWPKELSQAAKAENACIFERYDKLKSKLANLELTLDELKINYYEHRHLRQQLTPVSCSEHGIVTVRACTTEKQPSIVVELLNARNLKSYDSNDLSDPYAVVTLVPTECFPNAPTFTTKTHKETLFPLFEETFTIPVSKDDVAKKGFLMITLYDYDLIGRDELMGEALIPFGDLQTLGNASELETLPQIHLVLCKPNEKDEEALIWFDERKWDKDAVRFAKQQRSNM